MPDYKILPSILSADFACLGEEVTAVVKAGADMIHFDVMDNHYVPNLTVGPLVCKALRDYGIKTPIDVHLMTELVDDLIVNFAQAGATRITFHPETSADVERSLHLVKRHNCQVGLAFNPDVDLQSLTKYIAYLDVVLMMSVNPGFAGQEFIGEVLPKITAVRQLITGTNKNIALAVDGGINLKNIAEVAKAGADSFIAGSAIFSEKNYQKIIKQMRDKISANNL